MKYCPKFNIKSTDFCTSIFKIKGELWTKFKPIGKLYSGFNSKYHRPKFFYKMKTLTKSCIKAKGFRFRFNEKFEILHCHQFNIKSTDFCASSIKIEGELWTKVETNRNRVILIFEGFIRHTTIPVL